MIDRKVGDKQMQFEMSIGKSSGFFCGEGVGLQVRRHLSSVSVALSGLDSNSPWT